MSRSSSSSSGGGLLWFIFNIMTAMIGYHIHGSVFWAIIDFIFSPIVWIYWLCTQQVNLTIIKETFSFFLS